MSESTPAPQAPDASDVPEARDVSDVLDVLIIGGGPVGLALGVELARRGVSARIVDLNEEPSPYSRASVIQARTLSALADLGVSDELIRRGRQIRALGFYEGPDRLAHLSLDGMDPPFPFVLGISQRDTEEVLEARLCALGGRVERGVRFCGLSQHEGGEGAVLARLWHGDGGEEDVRCRYLVGCDGAHSEVRQALGVSFPGESYEDVVLQGDVHIRWPMAVPQDEILAFFGPGGLLAAMPLHAPGLFRVMALQPQESDVEPTLANLQALMDERGPGGVQFLDAAWVGTFRVRRRLASRYRVGRVLLAGDAAHNQSPITGQGMNLGIQDACNLGWKLALLCGGPARGPEALPEVLLDAYEAERRGAAEDTLASADELMRAFAPFMRLQGEEARLLHREVLATIAGREDLRLRVVREAGMLDTHYRGSAIVDEHLLPGAPIGSADWDEPAEDAASSWARPWDGPDGAPAAGEYLPEVPEAPLRAPGLGTDHVLLLFGGLRYPRQAHLDALAATVSARYGARVRPLLILAGEAGGGPGADPSFALHRRYGALRESLYLVRPDRYIAYRSQPADEAHLLAYLETIFS